MSDCTCCDECQPFDHPARFSFIYVQIVISIMLIFLMAQFVIVMFKKRKDILKYHDTISSFCACKHGWENRFLLIFTLVVSANMLCMHFEEYNSRTWDIDHHQQISLLIIFLFEITCIISFPFVGIFYTEGKHPDPNKHNKDYECPYGNCHIETSQKFHRCGAYLFMLGLCCTSIVWGVFFLNEWFEYTQLYPLAIFCLVWAVLQFIGGIVFVVLQIILSKNYRIKEAFQTGQNWRQSTQLDLELSKLDDDNAILKENKQHTYKQLDTTAEDEHYDVFTSQETEYDVYKDKDEIGTEQQRYRLIATKLRYFSFAVEGIVAASVIALCSLNTILRMVVDGERDIWN
eukprot:400103_1